MLANSRPSSERGVLAKRLSHYENARTASSGQDPTRTLVRLREALANADQMHVVLYNGEQGNAEAEEVFLAELRASGGFGCPQPHLSRACGTRRLGRCCRLFPSVCAGLL